MKKYVVLSRLLFIFALFLNSSSFAQAPVLGVIKSTINAESENAELCLEFNTPLSPLSSARLTSDLRLTAQGKLVNVPTIAITGTSLCLFPLERNISYHLEAAGLKGSNDEKMTSPYKLSFIIPDRSPTMAFARKYGDINKFGAYEDPLTLRSVNVKQATLEIYRINDPETQAHVWQDRAQTALAPSESAYLARTKGEAIWREEKIFDASANTTIEEEISLSDKVPNLSPGLYLLIADAGNENDKTATKGLAPLAVSWLTKSAFSLHAVRDSDGIHAFLSNNDLSDTKDAVHLVVLNKKLEHVMEADADSNGMSSLPYPTKPVDKDDLTSLIGFDKAGNSAFADIENLPALSGLPTLGLLHTDSLFVAPGQNVDLSLALNPLGGTAPLNVPSLVRLSQGDFVYTEFLLPPLTQDKAKLTFAAPASEGVWNLHWQKADGTTLADSSLRVSSNADAPHLEVTTEREALNSDSEWPVIIKSFTATGKAAPLVGGHIQMAWQIMDPAVLGWKNYRFGTVNTVDSSFVSVADFLTDLNGNAQAQFTLPKPPEERGLFQAVLKVRSDPDTGVAESKPLLLPFHSEGPLIGIKPLATEARFPQNGMARFGLVNLSMDGKPHEISGLSYQVYEEGRSFDWYQDEGRWNYKPEPQLRPIGGGSLTIKPPASILEWPVTAGNYRLEILDGFGKILSQTTFSAGGDSSPLPTEASGPLAVTLPKILQPGHEVKVHLMLPEAAMLTVLIADTRIRKFIHELRPKGDNSFSFTPTPDWPKTIGFSLEAVFQNKAHAPQKAFSEASVIQGRSAVENTGSPLSLMTTSDPSAIMLRKNTATALVFGLENNSDSGETYHYVVTASDGLEMGEGAKGDLHLNGKESGSFTVPLEATEIGSHELHLDITGSHAQKISHTWPIAVLPKTNALHSLETYTVKAKQPLYAKPVVHTVNSPTLAFVSRHSMDGLGEILSFVLNAAPFTTSELALTIEVLRQWHSLITQALLAPDFLIAARQQELLSQLLRHQNTDGGFGAYGGEESTIQATAAALLALGPETSDQAKLPKNLAITWIKQRLSNTWLEDKDREPRAAAYAALAEADAIDPSSLRYFSDTSATQTLPALADANLAAAFKHIHDPNAAAFWIKKMLDENKEPKSIALLHALAATDALSSDDVHAAMTAMTTDLKHNTSPDLRDAAALLEALAADNGDAGKWTIANDKKNHDTVGVVVLNMDDMPSYANGDSNSLSVTLLSQRKAPLPPLPQGASITRRFYHLNGTLVAPTTKPSGDEIYMVELKGALPSATDKKILVQDGGENGLNPLGCPLSAKLDALSFMPWFSAHELSQTSACELSSHTMSVILNEGDGSNFSLVYFAHIGAASLTDIPLPLLRILK